jgi:prohibitin 2
MKTELNLPKIIGGAVLVLICLVGGCSSYYIVNPGYRGVLVTNGSVSKLFKPEGLGFKAPFISEAKLVDVRQQTKGMSAECYSVDLQQVTAAVKVLYRVPEQSVVTIFQQYSGDPFDSLIQPRAQEALKEATAKRSAEQIVKEREQVKAEALAGLKKKVGDLLLIDDLVIENLDLSKDLEAAIESKMVQEQEKEKARFTKDKAEIDAQTAFIKAQGEAKAINIRGEALRNNPSIVNLTIAEKWDGKTPHTVVVGKGGSNTLLPLGE